MKNKTRYFIVFYIAMSETGTHAGNIGIAVNGQKPFLQHSKVANEIIKENPTYKNVVMTGFNEVTATEYKIWSETE